MQVLMEKLKDLENLFPTKQNTSLISITLVNITLSTIGVIIILALISYSLVLARLKTQALQQLEKYTLERGQRESSLFKLAEDNHKVLRQAFLDRYQKMGEQDPVEAFNQLFEPWDDGTLRARPKIYYGLAQEYGDVVSGITGFVGRNTDVTADGRRRAVIVYDLVRIYGPAWYNRFENLYISLFDNIGVLYWPGVPWDLEAPADFDMTEAAWFYQADSAHNPTRETIWTGLYYDPVAEDWMVTCTTPIDYDGRHIATIGSDVLLNELLTRTTEDYLEGTYNFIISGGGNLIAHPDWEGEIQKAGGEFDVLQTEDPNLAYVLQKIQHLQQTSLVFENAPADEYVAVTQIEGPDWYFVTVYPQSLIVGTARSVASLVFGLGVLSLLIEVTLLLGLLRGKVIHPLQEFVALTRKIAGEHFGPDVLEHLPLTRSDEIGQLAQSFNDMAARLQNSFSLLRASERKYRKLFEDSHDMIAITEPDGAFIDVNPAGERLLGYTHAEFLELRAQDIHVFPEEREKFRQLLERDQIIHNFEAQLRHRDGTQRAVLLSATLQHSEDHATMRFQTVVRDITDRKKAEQALRESERRFRSLVENMPVLINAQSERGRFVFWNRECEKVTGYKADEMIGHPNPLELLYPDPVYLKHLMDQWSTRGSQFTNWEIALTCKDGTRRTISWSNLSDLYPVPGWHSWAIGIDVTEQKRAEENLKRSESELKQAQRVAHIGSWVWDYQTDKVTWSEELYQIFGLDPEHDQPSIVANHERVHPDDVEPTLQAIEQALEEQTSGMVQQRIIHPDGKVRFLTLHFEGIFDANGNVTHVIGVAQDVTEQKLAEIERERLLAQVQAQARQMQQILDTVPEGVLLLSQQGQVIQANPVAKHNLAALGNDQAQGVITQLAGQSLAQFLALPEAGEWHEVTWGDQRFQIVARPIPNIQSSTTKPKNPPRRLDGPHSKFDTPSSKLATSTSSGAKLESWVLVIRDVTQIREYERRIQQQEKLAAIGQLAAGIAHDFNNVMATIVLYAQMTERDRSLSGRVRKRMATINQQAQHATNLIRQILDFSRRSILERRPLNLLPLFKEQVQLLERTLPENIQVNLTHDADQYLINADLTSMQQMVMNLAVNARDAMSSGGTLHIDLQRLTVQPGSPSPLPKMKQPLPITQDWVQVTVSDTGTGIAADILPHIFEPFFTTKAPLGSGLGLAQVHGIVGSHQGHINVETEMGRGTTFTIYLPILPTKPEKTLSKGQHVEQVAPLIGHRETILVVEDDTAVRQALVESLEQLNYNVVEATEGAQALEILKSANNKVDLVLSDVIMPGMGGITLFQSIRNLGLNIPVVLLTGHPLEKELERLQEGAELYLVDWLLKPLKMNQLADVVARGVQKLPIKAQPQRGQ